MFDFDGIPDDVPDWDGDGDVDGDDYFIDTMLMVEAYRDDVRSRGARASAPPLRGRYLLGLYDNWGADHVLYLSGGNAHRRLI